MASISRFVPGTLKAGIRSVATRVGWHGSPEFLIIGAQKAGTSALHRYLATHPALRPSLRKELYFFSPEALGRWTDHPDSVRLAQFAHQAETPREALRWYHAQFPLPRPGSPKRYYDTTPCYLYSAHAAQRIYSYRRDMKLIVLLRDPVERAYSAWNMARNFTAPPYEQLREQRGFEQAVRDEIERISLDPLEVGSDYVRRGIYHEQLRRYLALFPREQILILDSRDLKSRRWETLNAVCDFLGVAPFAHQEAWPPVLVGSYDEAIPAAARSLLTNFYAPHNAALFAAIGRSFGWSRRHQQPVPERTPLRRSA